MVLAVSDTGPINYLILIEQIDLLPRLFGQVRIASVVRNELGFTKAPATVRNWIAAPPSWLSVEVAHVEPSEILPPLDDGERATIALAKHIAADAVLMDDRAGVAVARSLGFVVVGTLGLLVAGARGGFVDLPSAFARLVRRASTAAESSSMVFSRSTETMDDVEPGRDSGAGLTTSPLRIAMWSGPRNISTAMLRSFGNRPDCAVSDEPFYAAYLASTGFDHPQRDEILANQPQDWRNVVAELTGPVPGGQPVWYQKHMTHHMLPAFGRDWIDGVANAFLIRAPEPVLASYVEKRAAVTLEEIGLPQQADLFDRVADRLGYAPPVIESRDVLADPGATLARLCRALGLPFDERMLTWPAGRRGTDGVWAPSWYDAVERSTGFADPKPDKTFDDLPDHLKPLAEAGRPFYERLARHKLG